MANNKIKDKYHIPFMIEQFKDYINKKQFKYPTFEELYLQNSWVKQSVHRILKDEAGKEINEETLTFWYMKLKEKQRKGILEKLYTNKSVQGLIFLAKYLKPLFLSEKKQKLELEAIDKNFGGLLFTSSNSLPAPFLYSL